MQSKHALIVALFAGAGALLIALGGLLSLSLLQASEPYLHGSTTKDGAGKDGKTNVPNFTTKLEGTQAQIVELDNDGRVVKVLYISELNDPQADFTLFAVPQTHYNGKIYVESVKDAEGNTLIVYPIDVATGAIEAAVLNVVSNDETVSPDQSRVAVINTTQVKNITAYDIATGATLASWTLEADERFNEVTGNTRTYTGEGVRWIDNSCFEHAVWVDNLMEMRSFCIESSN